MTPIATEFTEIGSLHADADRVYFVGASPTHFPAIVKLAPSSGGVSILKLSNAEDVRAFEGYLSTPQSIEFPTENGLTAFGLFYPPVNRDFTAQTGELPPLIVRSHGGPTSAFSSALDWSVQYWTSRGFAVLNVNYGGSTGYGRAYRERLRGQWGIVDVDDCVNGAKHLAATGKVDGERMAIRGGSAGGYTTLCALTFRNVFKTGASYYGVSDLEALAKDTHKFEFALSRRSDRSLSGAARLVPRTVACSFPRSPDGPDRFLPRCRGSYRPAQPGRSHGRGSEGIEAI